LRHFIEELEDLQGRLLEMGTLVESAIHNSVRALMERSETLAQQVLGNEDRINHLEIEIDELAVRLLALQQPMAKDLRFLTAAIKINTDLERMGDLAVNIVERAIALTNRPPVKPLIDIPQMARTAESMVRKSLDAFVSRDPDLARSVLASDDAVDNLRTASYHELISFMEDDPKNIRQAVDLLSVIRNLERIADHSTNIAEDVLFLSEGIDVRHHAETRG
jgi:phosphate transport system protein